MSDNITMDEFLKLAWGEPLIFPDTSALAGMDFANEIKMRFFKDVFKAIQNGELVRVKHGRWFISAKGTTCSECNVASLTTHRNYCPNCGAKVDAANNRQMTGK